MQSIYAYADYRRYLNDFYKERKERRRGYSFRLFSTAAGFSSPNYLKLIIDGHRNLTVSNIHGLAKALALKGSELNTFEALVHLNQATTSAERLYYKHRLSLLSGDRPKSKANVEPLAVLAEWYYPLLLLVAHGRTPKSSLEELRRYLRISEASAQKALVALETLGLLRLNGDCYEMTQQQVSIHDPKSLSKAQKTFLRDSVVASLRAFDTAYASGTAKFASHALTIPENALNHCFGRFLDFLDRLTVEMDAFAAADPTKSLRILQINGQLFTPSPIK